LKSLCLSYTSPERWLLLAEHADAALGSVAVAVSFVASIPSRHLADHVGVHGQVHDEQQGEVRADRPVRARLQTRLPCSRLAPYRVVPTAQVRATQIREAHLLVAQIKMVPLLVLSRIPGLTSLKQHRDHLAPDHPVSFHLKDLCREYCFSGRSIQENW
jgi:hypothetical protein